MVPMPRHTLAHLTHEAVEKLGGIGTVLEGLITSPVYQSAVRRSILIGPMAVVPGAHGTIQDRLGDHVRVLYSSRDGFDANGWSRRFRPIQLAFETHLAYGVRHFPAPAGGVPGSAEVLLIDVSNPSQTRLNVFKARLWERFGLDAARYEHQWDFEEYCRIAEPAFYALNALLTDDDMPCALFSHEFMGMCTALKAVMDGAGLFRTLFHAHECSTARRIVEEHPGHDTTFYNALAQASSQDLFVTDIFGDQSANMRHALISLTNHLDAVLAVSDFTAQEMRFLGPQMRSANIRTVYNGLPVYPADIAQEHASRSMMDSWVRNVTGRAFDLLLTHVARPVVSKGFWRDLRVCHELDALLARENRTALYLLITCGAPPRSAAEADRMAAAHRWPYEHVLGYPDLAGPEIGLHDMIADFNRTHRAVRAMLVNQFGWGPRFLGSACPDAMTFDDLRRATDVEFGQSVYEPFGIAHFEPLGSGAVCVASNVSGCVQALRSAAHRLNRPDALDLNVLIADYTRLDQPWSIPHLLAITQPERDAIESREARRVALDLLRRLPRTDSQRDVLMHLGQDLAHAMSWDRIVADQLLPVLDALRPAAPPALTAPESPIPSPASARSPA